MGRARRRMCRVPDESSNVPRLVRQLWPSTYKLTLRRYPELLLVSRHLTTEVRDAP